MTASVSAVVEEVRKNRGRSTILDLITIGGVLTTLAFTFHAGSKVNAVVDKVDRTEKRVDVIEPKVEEAHRRATATDLLMQVQLDSIQRDAAETKKDVRELRTEVREALRGK